MAVALPKDDWTPARLKDHQAWRKKMFAVPVVKPDPFVEKMSVDRTEPDISALQIRLKELEQMVISMRADMLQAQKMVDHYREKADEPDAPKFKLTDIIRVVAKYYEISVLDLKSSRRTLRLVKPRHVAMYFCREKTLRSLPEIGRHFGGRDHTTALHAVRKIEAKMRDDIELCREIAELEMLLG